MLYSETLITIIIPTSREKTILAMLLVILDEEGISIFITPFQALVNNVVVRFQKASIQCIEWKYSNINPARIVVISTNITVQDNFMIYE